MPPVPRVAIIYLSFHSEPYLDDVVGALKKITYPKDRVELVIVDNPHPKYGSSVRYIEETVLPLSGRDLPHVTLLPQAVNEGFSGGNNAGLRHALENGFDYAYLHNSDGYVAADFLEPLVAAMEKDPAIGQVQSLVLLHPEVELVNTSGNSFHYLGLGYCNNFRVPRAAVSLPPLTETNYASGAATLLSVPLLKKHGLWDEDFFLYHEDIEYSLRLRSRGFRVVTAAASIFYHKYTFGRTAEKFYYIERNRLGILLMFYRFPTLLLLLPMGLVFELGMLFFALRTGWLKSKLRSYGYWLNASHWRLWLRKRRRIQRERTVSDRVLLRSAVATVVFNERSVNTPLLRYVANPLMNIYWRAVKPLIFW